MTNASLEPVEAVLTLERGALGAAILDRSGKQARILLAMLREDHFISSLHRAVYRAISHLVSQNTLPLEYLSVIAELQSMGVFEQYSNGWSLVSSLGEGTVLARRMETRAQQLRHLAIAWQAKKKEERAR